MKQEFMGSLGSGDELGAVAIFYSLPREFCQTPVGVP